MTTQSRDEVHQSNRAFYDRISRAYDFISDSSEHQARQAGQQALQLQPGEQVLEIGFGTGNAVIDMARMVGRQGKVCGIDVSAGMKQVADDKISKLQLETPIELTVGDARQLPYADNTFDAAFMSFTLELFPDGDIPVVLGEVRRVLRPSGRLGVVSMAKVKSGEHPSLLEDAYVWMHRHFPHIVDCRPIDPAQLLSTAGLEIVQQIDMKMWTMPVSAVIGRKMSPA